MLSWFLTHYFTSSGVEAVESMISAFGSGGSTGWYAIFMNGAFECGTGSAKHTKRIQLLTKLD